MDQKDADGMANSVGTGEAAPKGAVCELGLHCLLRFICPNFYGMLFQVSKNDDNDDDDGYEDEADDIEDYYVGEDIDVQRDTEPMKVDRSVRISSC